jgi:predicted DNA-binding transcriptional regulator AlpA/predicted XRE-type DNA-binding protein
MAPTSTKRPGDMLTTLGIADRDIEAAKADLVAHVHRLLEHRRVWPEEAAAILNVSASELPALFRGRLATCSLDQLVRVSAWLGDDIDILIRPKPHNLKRGGVRLFKTDSVHLSDRPESNRGTEDNRSAYRQPGSARSQTLPPTGAVNELKLLDKWKVEEMTSLDITTIYRKIKAGDFPKPVRVGRRRVAWRESDIAAWQTRLEEGTRL